MSKKLSLDEAQALLEFLTGEKIPDGFTLPFPPALSPSQAFTVIYVLQEHFGVVPDHFEMCSNCGIIYDTNSEGHHDEKTGKDWCGGCF